jgi:hypothetical protein
LTFKRHGALSICSLGDQQSGLLTVFTAATIEASKALYLVVNVVS